MPGTIISTESTADLDRSLCVKYGISTIPLHITIGENGFEDGVNISPEDIYRTFNEKKILPKTAAVSIAEYSDYFETLSVNSQDIVHLSLSSALSSTYQNAVIAAGDFKNVHVVDTKSLSSGMALLVIKAAEMAQRHTPAEYIAGRLEQLKSRVVTTFILDRLEFLSKGGRCSAVTAFGANLLSIKPCILMKDGNLVVGKKYRGGAELCRLQYVRDLIAANEGKIDTSRVFIDRTSGVSDEQITNIKKTLSGLVKFDEYIDASAGCTIASHCGPGTFGLMFMTI